MARLPLNPMSVWGVVKELRTTAEDFRPLLVAGDPQHAGAIHAALVEGGDASAARDLSRTAPSAYDLEGARVLVYAVDGPSPDEEDEKVFRLAGRKGVEVVCVLVGVPSGEAPDVPHVQATDVVAVAPAEALPIGEIAERVAERADETSHHLAARLPALRPAVVESIVKGFSVQNGILGVAIFIPGADFPVLTLNQIRMVLRIGAAYGEELDRRSAVEVLSVVGAGLGFRAVSRQLAAVVPGLGWAVKGGVAYAGTRALGEAAEAFFAAGGTKRLEESVRSRS
jgi:uncharacterized protein (DUF697 family)